MAVEKMKAIKIWECKDCNNPVEDDNSVAFHLVEGILYGWCRNCYQDAMIKRAQQILQQVA